MIRWLRRRILANGKKQTGGHLDSWRSVRLCQQPSRRREFWKLFQKGSLLYSRTYRQYHVIVGHIQTRNHVGVFERCEAGQVVCRCRPSQHNAIKVTRRQRARGLWLSQRFRDYIIREFVHKRIHISFVCTHAHFCTGGKICRQSEEATGKLW